MAGNVPGSGTDGPGTHGAALGAGNVSGATAEQIDPVALGDRS